MTPRQRFLEQRRMKQNLAFAISSAVMLVAALLSVLVFVGIIPIPFGNEFSRAVKFAQPGDMPCPAEGARPVDPASINVQVLNATDRQGIAGEATTMLTAAGFKPMEPGNSNVGYPGVVEIDAGPRAINEAYTVARFFPKSKVSLTAATDKTVTVVLGTFYTGPLSAEETQKIVESKSPLVAPQSCLNLDPDQLADLAEQSGAQSGAQLGAQSGSSKKK
ncbi:LytR C-terminal domain-containing protein [Schaalia sp. ZJ405]|nr:LytR C-terminal domain-containing protein [Schaalia sp. ZJ405]